MSHYSDPAVKNDRTSPLKRSALRSTASLGSLGTSQGTGSMGMASMGSSNSEGCYPIQDVSPSDIVVALFDFPSKRSLNSKNLLPLIQGDTIYVLGKSENGWWDGIIIDGSGHVIRGWFPRNYVRSLQYPATHFSNIQTSTNDTNILVPRAQSKQRSSNRTAAGSSLGHSIRKGPAGALPVQSTSRGGSRRSSLPAQAQVHAQVQISQGHNAQGLRTSISPSGRPQLQSKTPSSSTVNSLPMSPMTSNHGFSSEDKVAKIPQQKQCPKPKGSPEQDHARSNEITVLPLQEIEMLFSSLNLDFVPLWIPVASTTSDRLLYYNKQLDLYCDQLPLLSNPPLETTTNIPNNDAIDLTPKTTVGPASHNEKTLKIVPHSRRSVATPASNTKSSLSSSSFINDSSRPSIDSTNNNINESFSSPNSGSRHRTTSEGSGSAQHGVKQGGFPLGSSSVIKKKPQGVQDTPHHGSHRGSRKAIPSEPGLFYHHTMDIKVWPELRDTSLYYARKAQEMFLKDNRADFGSYFQLASTYTAYTQMACRLCAIQFQHKYHLRELKRLLKKVIISLSRLSINSSLYFVCSQSESTSTQSTPRTSQSQTQLCNIAERAMKKPPFGSGLSKDLTPYIHSVSAPSSKELPFHACSSFPIANIQRKSSASSTRTSVPALDDSFLSERETFPFVNSLFTSIDLEFSHFIKTLQLVYHILQFSVAQSDWIPQLFPRFFEGSFNGGSWTNPFRYPTMKERRPSVDLKKEDDVNVKSSSTEALTPSSIGGFPQKVAEVIARAAGYDLQDMADDALWDSKSMPNRILMKNHRVLQRSFFNRPFHHRPFDRTKEPKIVQYALNETTINLMRKKVAELTNKFRIMDLDSRSEAHGSDEEVKTGKKRLEIISQIYDEVNSAGLLEILENLNISVFVNLRNLLKENKLETESEEFLKHELPSISTLLTEFFDIKQVLHDTVICLVMCTQHITLNDPYVFCAMKSNYPVGFFEPGLSVSQVTKSDRIAADLYKYLLVQDVDVNGVKFLKTSDDLSDACDRYEEVASLSCVVVEQLAREREILFNYATRMMRGDLATALLKGERDEWSEDYSLLHLHDEDEDSSIAGYLADTAKGTTFSGTVKDIPWFLTPEHEQDLIYDQRGRIKGGTRDALIGYLTNPEVVDAWFNVTMLLSFRSMFSTREFFYALAYRYNSYPPEGLSYDEYNLWVEKKLQPIKLRVVSIMKSLFSEYWNPSYYEPGIAGALSFAQNACNEQVPGASKLKILLKDIIANNGKSNHDFEEPDFAHSRGPSPGPPSNFMPNTGLLSHSLHDTKRIKLLDIDARAYASQLTLREHNNYLGISIFECLDRAWGTKYGDMGGSPNITKFIAGANSLTNYVSYIVVKQTDARMRARLITYFISVARYCREWNNFSSMTAIVSALCSSPIFRLKKTWPLVAKECREFLNEMNTLMDSTKNFINYRELLRSLKDVACVPFFGVFLSDLTFICCGNPDYLFGSSDIINFGKRARIVDILESIMDCKKIYYKLKRSRDIQNLLEESLSNVPHIEKQYELSLQVEPRDESSTHSASRHADTGAGLRPNTITGSSPNKHLKTTKKKQSSRLFG